MRVNKTSYYHIPGGHIEVGEDSEKAVIREIKENFWIRNNLKCHEIEFYYIVKANQPLQMIDYEKIEVDKGEENY